MSKEKVKNPFYKKWWVWLIAVIVIIIIVSGGDDDDPKTEPASAGADVEEVNNSNDNEEIIEEETEENEGEPEEIEEEPEEIVAEPEPEPIPDPIVYEGTGDDVIKIETTEDGPVVLYIKGNGNANHFAVKGYDDNDNSTELFVNTTDPYEGITLDPTGTTTLLEITSTGAWTVESRSARSLRVLESPGEISGAGDEILLVEGNTSLATIKGNKDEAHFAVKGYNPSTNLLVNTTDAYEGTTKMGKDTFLIEITAVGEWSIATE